MNLNKAWKYSQVKKAALKNSLLLNIEEKKIYIKITKIFSSSKKNISNLKIYKYYLKTWKIDKFFF